jgi:hypothetical protein
MTLRKFKKQLEIYIDFYNDMLFNKIFIRRVIVKEFNHWKEREEEMKRKDRQDLIIYGLCFIGVGVLVWISL